jgi:hypothetical protein
MEPVLLRVGSSFAKKVPAREFATTVDPFDEQDNDLQKSMLWLTQRVFRRLSHLFRQGSGTMLN